MLPKTGFFSEEKSPVNGGRNNGGPIEVQGLILKGGTVSIDIRLSGSLLSNEETMLTAEAPGKIAQISFREGDYVREGTLMAKINDKELQAQLRQNKLRIKLAEDREYRAKKLLEKEGISREEYDIILNELNVLKSDTEYILAQIEKREIRAPFSGIAGLRQVSAGAHVSPGTVIASLRDIDPLKLEFSVPQRYSARIKKGREIEFIIPPSSDKYSAEIYAIEPRLNSDTRSMDVRALVRQPKGLLPGTFAEVMLTVNTDSNALMVPSEALVPSLEGESVFIYSDGIADARPVKTGLRTSGEVQINSGAAEGDTVIVSGIVMLRPGLPVKLKNL